MLKIGSLPTFLINYTPYLSRKTSAISLLLSSGINNVQVVNCWDREQISVGLGNSQSIWEEKVLLFAHILAFNALGLDVRKSYQPSNFSDCNLDLYTRFPWMQYRQLSPGEISVCLKHFYAISSIACGVDDYGLIVEDDIGQIDSPRQNLDDLIEECYFLNADYVDIVGGCMLEPTEIELKNKPNNFNLCPIKPARTRTAAGYILSRKFATYLANSFLPLIFPIDWHLQFLLSTSEAVNAYWATRPIFTHGSEVGLYNSWRT
jgi:GR25 family glycosyltransferase involved in LPS biosynthesis